MGRARKIMIAWLLAVATLGALHWWQDHLMEDGAWIWSCHTMGNRDCAVGASWIEIRIGGAD